MLVSGDVHYTITGTDTLGQSATTTGVLNCSLIPATMIATVTGPEDGLGPLAGTQALRFTVEGWHWTANQDISLTYIAGAPLSYSFSDPTTYFTPGLPNSGSIGHFDVFFQDNCVDGSNNLVSGLVPYTITGTDLAGDSASVSGTLNCSLIPAS